MAEIVVTADWYGRQRDFICRSDGSLHRIESGWKARIGIWPKAGRVLAFDPRTRHLVALFDAAFAALKGQSDA